MPFDVWALYSQPAYFGPRGKAELRMRVLLGAIECLRNGITTVQDMNTLVPQDEETLDTILSAYEEVGIRVVFSIALRDKGALDIAPFLPPASLKPCSLAFKARTVIRYPTLPLSSGRSSAGAISATASAGGLVPPDLSDARASSWRDLRTWAQAGLAAIHPCI